MPELDKVFEHLSTHTVESNENALSVMERFVVAMYDRSSACTDVNECRRVLYTKKNRAIENIPPTCNALIQHLKRASLQAQIWTACFYANIEQYNPSDWGWRTSEHGYEPI